MKIKAVLTIALSIIIGFTFGKLVFNQYEGEEEKQVANEVTPVYAFQYGAYSSLENLEKYTKDLESFIYIEEDGYYKVFIAFTQQERNINKIKDVFENPGNTIYVKEILNYSSAFIETLKQYDLLIGETENVKGIKEIQKQIVNNYEELVLSSE